jgi:hypothetical protein
MSRDQRSVEACYILSWSLESSHRYSTILQHKDQSERAIPWWHSGFLLRKELADWYLMDSGSRLGMIQLQQRHLSNTSPLGMLHSSSLFRRRQ